VNESEQAQVAAERKLLSDTIDAVMQDAQTVESAEQAQAIAEIRAIRNGGEYLRAYYREAIDKALEIVDSQAQKIKSMEANYRELAGAWFDEREALGIQIAEQAKEIERLKDCMFQHMTSETYNHCQEYLEKMRGNNEKAN